MFSFLHVYRITFTFIMFDLPVTVGGLTPAAVNPLLAFFGRFLRSRRLNEANKTGFE